jgi:hypothetical protein
MQRKLEIIKYALRTRRPFLVPAILILLFFLISFLRGYHDYFKGLWDNFGDWTVAIATLFTAIAVWWSELADDWLESLPKKLTVVFEHNGAEIMRCNGAVLTSEADMRQLSQQIGRQMAGNQTLELKPMLDNWSKTLSKDKREVRYTVTIMLRNLTADLLQVRGRGNKLVWDPPFIQKPEEIAANG